MKKKTTQRKLDRIDALVAAASMPAPEARKVLTSLQAQLTERICPSRPPKPKFTPRFRSRFFAFVASQNLKAFAGQIRMAALVGDKLFFKYLAEYLKKEPKWSPMSEEQKKLLQLHFQKPHLPASEALKELCSQWSKGDYRAAKKRALERSELMTYVWLNGWIDHLR
jgi:hypothetical protein